jgi:hypothetical protein
MHDIVTGANGVEEARAYCAKEFLDAALERLAAEIAQPRCVDCP